MTTQRTTAAGLPTTDCSAWATLVISATRLTVLGGEKSAPGCERKYVGQYPKGLKQAETDALARGSALHSTGEIFQETGVIPDPESEVGTIFRSGSHLLTTCGKLLVEHEHRGLLPNGLPYVAYLDGHSPDGGPTACIVIQDLKTTGNPKFALVPGASDYGIRKNIQAMFYAWVMLCDVHWYAAPLGEGHYGPQQWKVWDPQAQGARIGRLRWLYFLTRGNPRAWDVSDHVDPEQAQAHMDTIILPLADRIRMLHQYHDAHPDSPLDAYDRDPRACTMRGSAGNWCGVGERDMCNFNALGTPITDLLQARVRPKTSPQERLAALKMTTQPTLPTTPVQEPITMSLDPNSPQARLAALRALKGLPPAAAAAPATPEPQPAPKAEPEQPATSADSTTAPDPTPAPTPDATPVAGATEPAPAKRGPGRPRTRPPAALTGAGINPPEGQQALALLTAEGPSGTPAAPTSTLDVLVHAIRQHIPRGVSLTIASALAVLLLVTATPVAAAPRPKTALIGISSTGRLFMGVMSSENICKTVASQLTEYAEAPPASDFKFTCVDPSTLLESAGGVES